MSNPTFEPFIICGCFLIPNCIFLVVIKVYFTLFTHYIIKYFNIEILLFKVIKNLIFILN